MTREEKIKFIVDGIYEVQGVKVDKSLFDIKTDEELDKEVEWIDYLLTK